jgi:hypothetical protein
MTHREREKKRINSQSFIYDVYTNIEARMKIFLRNKIIKVNSWAKREINAEYIFVIGESWAIGKENV